MKKYEFNADSIIKKIKYTNKIILIKNILKKILVCWLY